jgi:hypothetical protein
LIPDPLSCAWVLVLNIDVVINFESQSIALSGVGSSLEDDLVNIEWLVEVSLDPEVFARFAVGFAQDGSFWTIESWVGPVSAPLGFGLVWVSEVNHGFDGSSRWLWSVFSFAIRGDDKVNSGSWSDIITLIDEPDSS